MKKLLFVLAFFVSSFSFSQTIYKGKVLDSKTKEPIEDAIIKLMIDGQDTGDTTLTDLSGNFFFELKLAKDSNISFEIFAPAYEISRYIIASNNTDDIIFYLDYVGLEELLVSGMAISSASSWVGATLAYNFDGNSSENVIGAAKVNINTVKRFTGAFRLNVIGNIAKFTGIVEQDELDRGIRDLVQSSQGFSAGLEPLYTVKNDIDFTARVWGNLNYKLNQIQDVEVDLVKENVTLHQFRLAVGGEIEALEMTNGGRRMHFGLELSMTFFDEAKYQMVFNDTKSSLFAIEWSYILPLTGDLGLIVGQVISPSIKSALNVGIIIGTN